MFTFGHPNPGWAPPTSPCAATRSLPRSGLQLCRKIKTDSIALLPQASFMQNQHIKWLILPYIQGMEIHQRLQLRGRKTQCKTNLMLVRLSIALHVINSVTNLHHLAIAPDLIKSTFEVSVSIALLQLCVLSMS